MTDIILREEKNRAFAVELLGKLDLSKPWKVTIGRYVKTRTNNQLALYWSWLHIIGDETGNDPEELHELFKGKFILPVEKVIGDDVLLYRSTKTLSTIGMTEYMEKVEAFAASQIGIILPRPEDRRA
jgi:hypothetical protein